MEAEPASNTPRNELRTMLLFHDIWWRSHIPIEYLAYKTKWIVQRMPIQYPGSPPHSILARNIATSNDVMARLPISRVRRALESKVRGAVSYKQLGFSGVGLPSFDIVNLLKHYRTSALEHASPQKKTHLLTCHNIVQAMFPFFRCCLPIHQAKAMTAGSKDHFIVAHGSAEKYM